MLRDSRELHGRVSFEIDKNYRGLSGKRITVLGRRTGVDYITLPVLHEAISPKWQPKGQS